MSSFMHVHLVALRYFAETKRSGSMRQAAERLHVAASAVNRQILKLDARLVDVILKLAELYRQLGLMSEAMQHFESVAAHFHREGNTKEALATVKKLVDLDYDYMNKNDVDFKEWWDKVLKS